MHISRSTFLWYGIPILAFFLITLIFFSQPFDLSKIEQERTVDPLTPNTVLQLNAGETYVYLYNLSGILSNVTYMVLDLSETCTRVRVIVAGPDAPSSFDLCLNPQTGLADSALAPDFSLPWMLSLEEDFTWRATTRIIYPDPVELIDVTELTLTVLGEETYFGRRAFKVRERTVRTIDGEPEASLDHILWVDYEKRILLGSESIMFSIHLLSAPFLPEG